MNDFKSIAILTGAGISAESGLGTFRDKEGLWTQYDLSEVATPEGFAHNPAKVIAFYNARRENLAQAKPHAGHEALGRLQSVYAEQGLGRVTIITQNVDRLHEAGGAVDVIHMHGVLDGDLCNNCAHRRPNPGPIALEEPCPACGSLGTLRPDVVWFGEIPYEMERIQASVLGCDLFISIGTSGAVYPAAGLVSLAREVGAHTVELNLEPSEGDYLFAETRYGPASQVVPAYVAELLGKG